VTREKRPLPTFSITIETANLQTAEGRNIDDCLAAEERRGAGESPPPIEGRSGRRAGRAAATYLTPSSSTSKSRVALGGMAPPAPRAP
jgi:hypothetical protein